MAGAALRFPPSRYALRRAGRLWKRPLRRSADDADSRL